MNNPPQERCLPNYYVRAFLQSLENEIGVFSLHSMLRQSDLSNLIGQYPPKNSSRTVPAIKFVRFQQNIREYYGRGARGALQRTGQMVFDRVVQEATPIQKAGFMLMRLSSVQSRRKNVLDFLARWMMAIGGEVSVHTLDMDFIFVDASLELQKIPNVIEPVCWATTGMIQQAAYWATGEESDVQEISCRAMGAEVCKFRVHFP